MNNPQKVIQISVCVTKDNFEDNFDTKHIYGLTGDGLLVAWDFEDKVWRSMFNRQEIKTFPL